MVLKFFKEYKPVGFGRTDPNVREWQRIIQNYMLTDFLFDFIPIIPLQVIELIRHRERLFYLIKVVRFYKGFKVLKVSALMQQIKKYFDDYLIERCKVDEEFANNRDESKNNIETILFISYALKTIQLTVVILNISYILGMFWIILC